MNLITEYPTWFLLFCLLLGATYAGMLYWRERLLEDVSVWLRRVMAFFRFTVVSLLAFLLLNPLLKTVFREVEKPIIIIAQDDSESLAISGDTAYYRTAYRDAVKALQERLAEKFDVKTYSFGDALQEEFDLQLDQKQTDISQLFDELFTRYSGRNVGAVVLATDGIYNKGSNPTYTADRLKVPVYTIALGDTTIRKDLVISRVAHNRLAYLGNDFPLEILVDARRCAGSRVQLTVSKGATTLFTQFFDVESPDLLQKFPLLIEAKETGIQKYTIRLSELEDEASFENNSYDIFIDVLDSRQKILMLAQSPHPDIAAIRSAIESNDNYEVTASLLRGFQEGVGEYNLVVLHQVPSFASPASQFMSELNLRNIPVLYILGSQTHMASFNGMGAGMSIMGSSGKRPNTSQGIFNRSFSQFSLSAECANFIQKCPPLKSPFGNYKVANSASVLFKQKIGVVPTDQPLIHFNSLADSKVGVISGEGIWRWRLNDYAQHRNHNRFNELVSKLVQYLAARDDKSRFRVSGENGFLENQNILLDAELYNEAYELTNEPDVKIEVTNAEGNKFPFTFSRAGNAYRLDAGALPVGEYKYRAQTKLGEEVFVETGEFSVSGIQVESVNLVADHQLLFGLSERSGGEMFYPTELEQLGTKLTSREDIVPISYSQKRLRDLINEKWLFFLLLGLISMEWLMRKRNGAY